MNTPIYITRTAYDRLSFWQRVGFWLAAGSSGTYVRVSDVRLPKARRRVRR